MISQIHNLDLDTVAPLRQGKTRNIYVVDEFPDLLLKTIRPDIITSSGHIKYKGIFKNFRPEGCYQVFIREFTEFAIQSRRQVFVDGFRLPIAHIYGFVQTSHGLGMLTERIVGADGNLAPTLHDLKRNGGLDDRHMLAMRRFRQRCIDLQVVLGDNNATNVVYTEQRSGEPEFVAIDGFGEKAFIPVHRWSRFFNTMRIKRTFNKKLALE